LLEERLGVANKGKKQCGTLGDNRSTSCAAEEIRKAARSSANYGSK